jgi:beta-N-acetylglucosaminidase
MATKQNLSKKGRKIGRNKAKPCHMRYAQEKRWNKNKLARAKKLKKKFGHPVKIKYFGEWLTV